jgi:hypothetical protein
MGNKFYEKSWLQKCVEYFLNTYMSDRYSSTYTLYNLLRQDPFGTSCVVGASNLARVTDITKRLYYKFALEKSKSKS